MTLLTLPFDPPPSPQAAWCEGKMPFAFALACAQAYKEMLGPCCKRIEIAGSLRRHKPLVHDIELVAIENNIGDIQSRLARFRFDRELVNFWKKRGTRYLAFLDLQPECGPFIYKNVIPAEAGNYLNCAKAATNLRPVPVDIFLSQPEYWGWTFFIRTGSHEWNLAVMQEMNRRGYRTENNKTFLPKKVLPAKAGTNLEYIQFREESEIFDLLGLPYLEPWERHDQKSLIRAAHLQIAGPRPIPGSLKTIEDFSGKGFIGLQESPHEAINV